MVDMLGDFDMTLTDITLTGKVKFFSFAIIVITFSGQNNTHIFTKMLDEFDMTFI